MNQKNTKKIFHVNGMHCRACVMLIESDIGDLPYISNVKVSLDNRTVEVEGEFGNQTDEQIAESLTAAVKAHKYTITVEKQVQVKKWNDFKYAVPITIAFILLFISLQKMGLINLIGSSEMNYGTIFVVGIVASLSSCMAVVGALLLSMSATFAKEGDKVKPQLMFHVGRIVSFFILGGVIGAIGSAFTLNANASLILSVVIAFVMIILGLNLLDVFPWAKKLQPSMPKFIANRAHSISKLNHSLTPLLVGIATFFLPCGFTQSMQLYTLSTKNFLEGGMTMLTFALGTLPVLLVLSFSSFSIKDSKKSGIFFKTAGLIVIIFSIFNLINGMAAAGIISPVFNF